MNNQRPETVCDSPSQITVQGVPWHTIQGEGPFSGRPCVFVRLAGCNVQCPACDTDYTSDPQPMTLDDLYLDIDQMCNEYQVNLVVITGGEPLRQPNALAALCEKLVHGYAQREVQIETNGIGNAPLTPDPRLTVVCSPKGPFVGADIVKRIDYWKYVIKDRQTSDQDGLPLHHLGRMGGQPCRPHAGFPRHRIYVQGMDEGVGKEGLTERNCYAAAQAALKYGYTFGLQVHKFVGMP